jgi:hypothetical protein
MGEKGVKGNQDKGFIMELSIIRKIFTNKSTIGDFMVNGIRYYYSLEDKDRQRQENGMIIPWTKEVKIPGVTAIPYGQYEVVTSYSNRFKQIMPLLLNVPDYEGVRIHSGNTDKNTEGCPLIGYTKVENFIGESKRAFNDFFPRLMATLKKGKVFITITGQMMGA